MHSPDGINWTFEGLPSNGIGAHAWRDAVVHGGEIIIIAAGGQVVTTADGRNFVAVLPGVEGAAGLQKILSDGRGALMVVGNAGPVRCAVSSDGGRTWGVRTALNPDKAWIGLGYFAKKGTWIASNTNIVTGERFAVSADLGLTWRWIPIPSSLTGRYFIDLGDSLWWGSDGGVNLAGAPISAGESLDGVDYSFFTNTRVSGMQGMAWDGRNTAIAMMTGGHIIRRERI
jgi:hypothetical protein